jgi:hypothetical protein
MLQNIIPVLVSQVMPKVVASGLLVSTCVIQAPSGAVTAYNQPDGTFVDILTAQCEDAPLGFGGGIDANETKQLSDTLAGGYRHVFLAAYYPQIPTGTGSGWRAVIDGTVYDLLGAENDSQRSQTRLRLQLVTI